MRAIFLNIWQGQVWDKLQKFIEDETPKTDIFGFVEVDPRILEKLVKILPGYDVTYGKFSKINFLDGVYEGRAIFFKKGINIKESKNLELYEITDSEAGGLQYAELEVNGKSLFIGLVHGVSKPGDKTDTEERLEQSRRAIEAFKGKSPVIIGGDFNLYPDTESVKMFEKSGYRNLIRDYGITNTRNKLSWAQFPDPQFFADYCFVSKDVKVNNFEVPNVEVSDHEPLIIDFEI